MARIEYWAGLDYDLLPTAKKRRVLAPPLAGKPSDISLSEAYTKRIGYIPAPSSGDDNSTRAPSISSSSSSSSSSSYPSQNSDYGHTNRRSVNNNSARPTPPSVPPNQYSSSFRSASDLSSQETIIYSPNNYTTTTNNNNNRTSNSYNNQPTPQPLRPYNSNRDSSGYISSQNTPSSGYFHTDNHPSNTINVDNRTLHATLKKYFKFDSFRENQLQAVEATCAGLDTLILMPTGGGKSICYQLPAILSNGLSIVVSPLKSLISDQVTRLKSLNVETSALFGDIPPSEVDEIMQDLQSSQPRHKLLYVTPEKISASTSLKRIFRSLYNRGLLARFVIDEAHCVSMWGSDFRPDYRKLGVLRKEFPKVPIMALTATAPQKVRDDILDQLGMNKFTGKTFIQSFNRPNLKFEVRVKNKNCIDEISKLIRANHRGQCGIIYCFSRNDCLKVSEDLQEQGITSAPYHAGLSDPQRERVFTNWSRGSFQVVCATVAFGMGIDKSDVRFVFHYSLPKSIEGYYQEAGRAGRDGKFASCILYYSKSDIAKMRSLLSKTGFGRKVTDKNRDTGNFRHMIDYCEKNDCRRSTLLSYLGEQFNRQECIRNITTACDNCLAARNH